MGLIVMIQRKKTLNKGIIACLSPILQGSLKSLNIFYSTSLFRRTVCINEAGV